MNLFQFPIGLGAHLLIETIMKKRKKRSKVTASSIIGAIFFGVLMAALIVFAMFYDPNKHYSNSFFDDVATFINAGNE